MSAGVAPTDDVKPENPALIRKTSDSSIASVDFGFGTDFDTALASPSTEIKIPEGSPPPDPHASAAVAAAPVTPTPNRRPPTTPAASASAPGGALPEIDDAATAFLKAKANAQGHHNQAVASPSAGLNFAAYGAEEDPSKTIAYKSVRFKKSKWRQKLDEATFDDEGTIISAEPAAPPANPRIQRQRKGAESWFSSLRRKKPGAGVDL